MKSRVVCVYADLMDDEAERLTDLLLKSKDDGLMALAKEIERARRETPDTMASMPTDWETPRVRLLREMCDVDGCTNKADPEDMNDFCAQHAHEWETSTGYFELNS